MFQSKDSKASWELLRTVFHLPTALCNVSALNTPFQRLSQINYIKISVFNMIYFNTSIAFVNLIFPYQSSIPLFLLL